MSNKSIPIRRIAEKSFRQEMIELLKRHGDKSGSPLPQNMTGLMQIHFNNGCIDWTKLEISNQF